MGDQRDWIALQKMLTESLEDLLLGQPDRIKTLKDADELAAHLADDVYSMFDLEARRPGIGSRAQDH
jgi:hypothetical protein